MATVTGFASTNAVVTTGWTNPTNAYADDTSYATATIAAKTTVVASRFGGFGVQASIPSSSTINSVTAEAVFKVSTTASVARFDLQLEWPSGTLQGTQTQDATEPTTDKVITQAVAAGLTWANLADGTLFVRATADQGNSATSCTYSLDYVKVTVDYTPPTNVDSPALELSGFGTFTGVDANDIINAVVATVNLFASTALMDPPTYELWDGTTAIIGVAQTGVDSTDAAYTDTISFPGVTYAQLATLRLRVYGHSGSATTGATLSMDYASLAVNYTPVGAFQSVAFDSSGTNAFTTSASSATVDITTAATDSWCYAFAALGALQTATAMTGWTLLGEGPGGGSTPANWYAVWRRRKVAGDTTFTMSWGTSTKGCVHWASYTGVDPTTPDESFAFVAHSSTGSTAFPTPLSPPTAANRWALAGFYTRSTTAGGFTWTADAGLTERVDLSTTGGTNPWTGIQIADSVGAVTQANHTYTATCSASESQGGAWLAYLVPAPVSGGASLSADASLAATATLTAGGDRAAPVAATLSATATLTAAGTVTSAGATATLAASATLTAGAALSAATAASLTGTATLTAAAARTAPAAASLAATATLTAAGTRTALPAAGLAATATLTDAATLSAVATASLGVTATLTADAVTGAAPITAAATLTATATLTAADIRTALPAATLPATVTLSAGGTSSYVAAATLPVTVSLVGGAAWATSSGASLIVTVTSTAGATSGATAAPGQLASAVATSSLTVTTAGATLTQSSAGPQLASATSAATLTLTTTGGRLA